MPTPDRAQVTTEHEAEMEPVQFLCNVLTDAAKQFRLYESLHARKGTPDGDEKALTNAAHALACEAAVAMAQASKSPAPQAAPDLGDDREELIAFLERFRNSAATVGSMVAAIQKAGFRRFPSPEVLQGGIEP